MKTIARNLSLLALLFLLNSMRCENRIPLDSYEAVVMDREEFENSVVVLPPTEVANSGKIYIKDDLMFVNDFRKGFHVYNYANPQNPIPLAFIKTIGATDLAVRDNTLYINQAVDLLTLNYNVSTGAITVGHRNRNVFPQMLSPSGGMHYSNDEDEIVVNWIADQN